MSIINHLKLKKNNARATILCIIILFSIFSQTIGYSLGAEFQITAKEDDILMYKLTFDNEVSYAKFQINKTYENTSSILISYNAYFAENLTEINETDVVHSNSSLNGNITEDLFESGSILNLILPTPFSAKTSAIAPPKPPATAFSSILIIFLVSLADLIIVALSIGFIVTKAYEVPKINDISWTYIVLPTVALVTFNVTYYSCCRLLF